MRTSSETKCLRGCCDGSFKTHLTSVCWPKVELSQRGVGRYQWVGHEPRPQLLCKVCPLAARLSLHESWKQKSMNKQMQLLIHSLLSITRKPCGTQWSTAMSVSAVRLPSAVQRTIEPLAARRHNRRAEPWQPTGQWVHRARLPLRSHLRLWEVLILISGCCILSTPQTSKMVWPKQVKHAKFHLLCCCYHSNRQITSDGQRVASCRKKSVWPLPHPRTFTPPHRCPESFFSEPKNSFRYDKFSEQLFF